MDWPLILGFSALVFIGSYVQAAVGFAIAMVVAGGAAILELAPMAFTANIISIIALSSTFGALHRRFHLVNWRLVGIIALAMIPCALLGLWLLFELSANSVATLELLLGVVILLSGLSFVVHPHPRSTESGIPAHLLAGGLGGLLMGLFSTGGPPVIIHLYRQPLAFHVARNTVLTVLGLMALTRLLAELVNGNIHGQVLEVGLISVPVSILAVVVARRYPLPFGDDGMRRVSFVMLALIGLALIVTRL